MFTAIVIEWNVCVICFGNQPMFIDMECLCSKF